MDFIGSGGDEELGSGRQRLVESRRRRRESGVTAPISAKGVGEERGDVGRSGPTGGCESAGRRRWTETRRGPNRRDEWLETANAVAAEERRATAKQAMGAAWRRLGRWLGAAAARNRRSPARGRDGERRGEYGKGRGELGQFGKMREGGAGMDFTGSGGGEELG
uniref:Uncharacterized protein n=1 Tax=Oryza nivara TaxID=4536 RepID=A0A0E0FJ89_ORYNI